MAPAFFRLATTPRHSSNLLINLLYEKSFHHAFSTLLDGGSPPLPATHKVLNLPWLTNSRLMLTTNHVRYFPFPQSASSSGTKRNSTPSSTMA